MKAETIPPLFVLSESRQQDEPDPLDDDQASELEDELEPQDDEDEACDEVGPHGSDEPPPPKKKSGH